MCFKWNVASSNGVNSVYGILPQSPTQSPNLPYAKAQSGLTQSYYTSLPFAPLASLDFLSPISVGRAGAITA